jgi:hypothetical protein
MSNRVKGKVKQEVSNWDEAIQAAKDKIKYAERWLMRLKNTLRNFEKLRESGQKFPYKNAS